MSEERKGINFFDAVHNLTLVEQSCEIIKNVKLATSFITKSERVKICPASDLMTRFCVKAVYEMLKSAKAAMHYNSRLKNPRAIG